MIFLKVCLFLRVPAASGASFKFPDMRPVLRSYFSADAIDGKPFIAAPVIGFAFLKSTQTLHLFVAVFCVFILRK